MHPRPPPKRTAHDRADGHIRRRVRRERGLAQHGIPRVRVQVKVEVRRHPRGDSVDESIGARQTLRRIKSPKPGGSCQRTELHGSPGSRRSRGQQRGDVRQRWGLRRWESGERRIPGQPWNRVAVEKCLPRPKAPDSTPTANRSGTPAPTRAFAKLPSKLEWGYDPSPSRRNGIDATVFNRG